MTTHLPARTLDVARQQAELTVDELWVRYFGNGGTATSTEFTAFLTDHAWPTDLQYDIAASALNEQFTEMGLDHPVPYTNPAVDGWAGNP